MTIERRSNQWRPWSQEEDGVLRSCRAKADACAALADYGRSAKAVEARARMLGHRWSGIATAKPGLRWRDDEIAILRACRTRKEMYAALPHRSNAAIDNAMSRVYEPSPRSRRAHELVERKCLRCRQPTRVPRVCFLCEPCRAAATEDMGL